MSRFAYLFLAHKDIPVLQTAIDLIDDPRNDIFIHWDLKSAEDTSTLTAKHSRIYFTKRTRCYWGDEIEALYLLLELARSKDEYAYYHFLTAEELPIKHQDYIHRFFEEDPNQSIYLHINVGTFKDIQGRCKYYYPFIDHDCFKGNKLVKALSLVLGKAQGIVGIDRRRKHPDFFPLYNGWGWGSIPGDFADYVLSRKEDTIDVFRKTLAGDEAWLHSLAMHHPDFSQRMYGYNGLDDPVDASKLFQDWNRGKPYTFTMEDLDLLLNSNALFARKFSSFKDAELVEAIKREILG
ncbi:MAG: hypothetical protein IJS37_00930 [Bacilli bacterium]|nr:hypothetical protein [Bacilli bacterium]